MCLVQYRERPALGKRCPVHRQHIVAVVLALLLVGPNVAAGKEAFAKIDKHALAAGEDDEKTVATLAKYLAGPCKTDADKARAGLPLGQRSHRL